MKMTAIVRVLALLPPIALAISPAATRAATIHLNGQTFILPDGFTVELAAAPPLADRPITADFDEQGHLYVADSSGSNEPVKTQLEQKPHRILRLEDTDGDGRFDRSTVFADRMMFPEGTLWHRGSLYVTAPPSIWKLTDTDGDGVADVREEWFDAKTLTGCANDLHGPYLGPDGLIYWCKGAFARQDHPQPDGSTFSSRAAHIFRRHPDGGHVEPVMTGGMDNPVDVVFTPEGERVFTTTFFQHPGGGQRDGLIHAVYGGVYGKPHDVLDDHPRTGDLMPVLTHMGPAAPCGLTRHSGAGYGPDYRDNLFACQFNLHKVSRHILHPRGATFQTLDEDFLVSDHVDFHPTDVIEDADGSLLVVDTGGWYKLCCPTSQLHKPDVLGAIYRVRRAGAPVVADPRGRNLDWDDANPAELAARLKDPRPAVVERAVIALAARGPSVVPLLAEQLQTQSDPDVRRHAVWCLTRIRAASARAALRVALRDTDESVAHAAIHSAALHRDPLALPALLPILRRSSSPTLQRAAAEAAGRIRDGAAVPELLTAAGMVQNDRILEHSMIYALIEIGDPKATAAGLEPGRPSATRRAALIALDQMKGGRLDPALVTPLLVSSDPILKDTAAWLVDRHADWAGALAKFFGDQLINPDLPSGERSELERRLAAMAHDASIQQLVARQAGAPDAPRASRISALRVMSRARLKQPPASWESVLARLLQQDDLEITEPAVDAARALPPSKESNVSGELRGALEQVANHGAIPPQVRLRAMAAMISGAGSFPSSWFDLARSSVNHEQPVATRALAAEVLGQGPLDSSQLAELLEVLVLAGPMELPKLVQAYSKARDEILGVQLIAALDQCTARSTLRAEWLQPALASFPESIQAKASTLLASIHTDSAGQKRRLDALLTELKDGDVRRGQAVFNSAQAACASCHAIGYLGGKLGPDLTRIGQIRTERDLLEAVVYPSASFVRSYEPVVVATAGGEDHSGILRRDALDEVILATGPDTEVRIARVDIASIRPGDVSVMPGGLDEQLTRQQLADLLAFLKATRW